MHFVRARGGLTGASPDEIQRTPTTASTNHSNGSGSKQTVASTWIRTENARVPRLLYGNESPLMKARAASILGLPHRGSSAPMLGRFSPKIVEHTLFKAFINVVIIVGAIQMGFAVELDNSSWKRVWAIWDHFYSVVATTEMVLMMEAFRFRYFTTPWMLLDFGLAITGILDVWVFPSAGVSSDLGIIRILRLLRVLRVLRISKVIPGFAIVIEGLVNSLRSMIWVFALAFVILYAGSICCVTLLGQADAGYPAFSHDPNKVRETILGDFNSFIFFGSVYRSMITLLGMMLLSEWTLVRQVAEVHYMMVPLFIFLLLIVTFGVLNVIIGVVVEKTTEAMNQPRLEEFERGQNEKAALAESIADALYTIDTDGDGRVSVEELEKALENSDFANILEHLDLPHGFTVVEFVSMLDVDGSGTLSKHEFVSGLYRLIFCSNWQRDCMHAMTVGMLHHSLMRVGHELRAEIRTSVKQMRAEFQMTMKSVVTEVCRANRGRESITSKRDVINDYSREFSVLKPASSWEVLPAENAISVARTSQRGRPSGQHVVSNDKTAADIESDSINLIGVIPVNVNRENNQFLVVPPVTLGVPSQKEPARDAAGDTIQGTPHSPTPSPAGFWHSHGDDTRPRLEHFSVEV